jgi:hypothetical protein
MPIDPANPPNQVTENDAAIPVNIVGYSPPMDPANPPNFITIPQGAIPVYIVPKPI